MIGCGFVSSTHIIWSMMMKDPVDLHHLQRFQEIRRLFLDLSQPRDRNWKKKQYPTGEAVEIGIARTNSYRDLCKI